MTENIHHRPVLISKREGGIFSQKRSESEGFLPRLRDHESRAKVAPPFKAALEFGEAKANQRDAKSRRVEVPVRFAMTPRRSGGEHDHHRFLVATYILLRVFGFGVLLRLALWMWGSLVLRGRTGSVLCRRRA
jgi:hypothetical protein